MDVGHGTRLSFAQQRLWFLDQLHPGSPDYLLPMVLRLRGAVDVPALAGALAAVAGRHDVLRTRHPSLDGRAGVEVDDPAAVVLGEVDLAGADADADAWVERELRRPVHLGTDLPLRATLARLRDGEHLLVIVVHHIAFDFASWGVFTRELAAFYGERTGHGPADLPPLPIRYAEHARRQQERLSGSRLARGLEHWRTRLAGLEPLRLPLDRPRPADWDGAGDVVRFTVPAEVVGGIDRLARDHRCTRFMALLAAFQVLLGRHTGQRDVAVGTPVSGRDRLDVADLIGLFVNTVVLRTDLSGEPTFGALLDRVRAGMLTDLGHADVPFEQVVAEVAPRRDLARHPLFAVSFSLLSGDRNGAVDLPGLDVRMESTPVTGQPCDVVLDMVVCPDGLLAGRLHYATALFDRYSMALLGEGYLELLRGLLADPDAPVGDAATKVPPLPGRDRARLLAAGNDTAAPLPDATVVELIERQVRETPDALAVRAAAGNLAPETLSYAELDAHANRLARHLLARGVGPGTLVGILLDRTADLPVAFLAVLKTGAAYLPLDPSHPAQRLAFLLADAGAGLLVTDAGRGFDAPTLRLDQEQDAIAAHDGTGLGRLATPDDLAYVIHTSGSTGTPKGVLIDHRGLTAFLAAMLDRPGLRPDRGVIALTTVSFDPSVLELYLPLLVGAHLVVATAEEARDPGRLARLVADTRPQTLQATPVALRSLVDAGWQPPPGLTVLSGGEKLPVELARRLAAGGARVWDLYGPTEATVWSTTARLAADGAVLDWAPRANSTAYLLDGRMEPVPDGTVGELYLGGTGLAQGYHGRPRQTAERFVPDPYGAAAGGRLYRTGDLARRDPDGAVRILGRADHQVKIHGHRMEPGEIEAALLAHPAVRAAVVHPTPTADGGLQLTAYLVPAGALPRPDQLRAFLLRTLPDYMAPAAYVPLAAFPVTTSGKVDRNALPLPEAPARPAGEPPRTPEERAVAAAWHEVLGTDAFGVHDDFFDVGGHSLLATRVSIRLRRTLGVDVAARALFDHGTVAALAAALPQYPRVSEQGGTPVLRPRRRVPAGTSQ